ncbi:MAG: hypothetical protein QM831_16520 [Kofleriaceae bacterium]
MSNLVVVGAHDPLARWITNADLAFEDRADYTGKLASIAPSGPILELAGMTGAERCLTFNGRALDTEIPRVRALYRGLTDHGVFARLGITSIQLSGCTTAIGERARRTLTTLSEIIGLPVTGTQDLMTASEVGGRVGGAWTMSPWSGTLCLDLEALPSRDTPSVGARVLTSAEGRQALACVRRMGGMVVPELLALPLATLALPLGDRFYELEVLLDYDYVRAGDTVWPVEDPRALRATCGTP